MVLRSDPIAEKEACGPVRVTHPVCWLGWLGDDISRPVKYGGIGIPVVLGFPRYPYDKQGFLMLLDGQGQFVFHFRQAGDPDDYICLFGFTGASTDPTLDATVLAYVHAAWVDNILPQQASNIVLAQVEMEVNDGGGITGISSTGSDSGGISDNAMLQNTALLMKKRTTAAGRGAHGRNYVPGVPEDAVDNVGVLNLGYLSDLNDAAAEFLSDCNTPEDIVLTVNHKTGSTFGLTTLINNLSFDPVCASQRRRLRGRR